MNSKNVYWWIDGKKLIFLDEKATPDFWDRQWKSENWVRQIPKFRKSWYWHRIVSKYILDENAKILEGGCGDGHLVDAMTFWGYNAIGIDFASETVRKINEKMPNLDVRYGDVQRLEFPDNFFDGYFSLGVIEHFWEGYNDILKEMKRVLKVGGYAFVSFPCISRLDRLKIFFSGYKKFMSLNIPHNFYQFGLDVSITRKNFERVGFQCLHISRRDGWNGLKRLWPAVDWVHRGLLRLSKKSRGIELLTKGMGFLMAPLCGHSVLLILRLDGLR